MHRSFLLVARLALAGWVALPASCESPSLTPGAVDAGGPVDAGGLVDARGPVDAGPVDAGPVVCPVDGGDSVVCYSGHLLENRQCSDAGPHVADLCPCPCAEGTESCGVEEPATFEVPAGCTDLSACYEVRSEMVVTADGGTELHLTETNVCDEAIRCYTYIRYGWVYGDSIHQLSYCLSSLPEGYPPSSVLWDAYLPVDQTDVGGVLFARLYCVPVTDDVSACLPPLGADEVAATVCPEIRPVCE
jgi:hypothetical protein